MKKYKLMPAVWHGPVSIKILVLLVAVLPSLAGRPHYAKEMGIYDDCHVVLYTYWCVKCHCITKFKPELFFSLPEGGWHERTGTAISEKKEIENEQQWMHGWIRCLAKLMNPAHLHAIQYG
ncbi:hypothetical protein OUZ56_004697 [Daphnia magna]|uniref:Secreted protein n=1 Tax=Daphnia magna TaxID=35525 RepID=A0ABQ9YQL0_9CRUS|nr:hypothetical protein OUZ56_004697 [Daphnia magna]